MTLSLLEGSFLDLGPEFWAFTIVVALIVIEIFQLGPHSLSSSKGKVKEEDQPDSGAVGVARKGSGILVQKAFINKKLFRRLVINTCNLGERDALLYIGEGDGDFNSVPMRPPQASTDDSHTSDCTLSENFAICRNKDDPVVMILREVMPLWAAKDRQSARHVVLYSQLAPSTYAVQQIASTLKSYAKQVNVSVFYSKEDKEDGRMSDKLDHLRIHNIIMEKI